MNILKNCNLVLLPPIHQNRDNLIDQVIYQENVQDFDFFSKYSILSIVSTDNRVPLKIKKWMIKSRIYLLAMKKNF